MGNICLPDNLSLRMTQMMSSLAWYASIPLALILITQHKYSQVFTTRDANEVEGTFTPLFTPLITPCITHTERSYSLGE
jgi:hypothetical protein